MVLLFLFVYVVIIWLVFFELLLFKVIFVWLFLFVSVVFSMGVILFVKFVVNEINWLVIGVFLLSKVVVIVFLLFLLIGLFEEKGKLELLIIESFNEIVLLLLFVCELLDVKLKVLLKVFLLIM